MFVALGDTHRTEGHGLTGQTLTAVRTADVVAHTGDFTTRAVHDAIEAEAARFHAVAGNNDEPPLATDLQQRATFTAEGLRVVVVHGHEHSNQALSLLGRDVGADLVIAGHSHRPEIQEAAGCTLLNPGSHADPRWHQPAHAELEAGADGVSVQLVKPDGTVLESTTISSGT